MTDGLRVVARDGTYVEELQGYDNGRWGAVERSGTYDLTIEAPGFETKTVEDVRVRQGDCHVQGAERTAELVPLVELR